MAFASVLLLTSAGMLIVGLAFPQVILFWSDQRARWKAVAAAVAVFVPGVLIIALDQSSGRRLPQTRLEAPAREAEVSVAQRPPPPTKDPNYRDISLDDLKLDKERLIGKKIRVSGLYQLMGDESLLAGDPGDMSPLWLDVHKVPREERKAMLDCPDRQCTFEIEGTVRRGLFGVMIVADHAEKQ